jgi:hypothetical protein
MPAYIKAADVLKEKYHCLVLIIHHCGIAGNRPRGHTSLTGAVDVQIWVLRDDQNNTIARVQHFRDGVEGAEFFSRLEIVPLGIDDDGEHVDSCVIVPSDDVAPKGEKEAVQGDKKTALLREIQNSPNLRQTDLCELTGIKKNYMSKLIGICMKNGWIKQGANNKYRILKKGEIELKECKEAEVVSGDEIPF